MTSRKSQIQTQIFIYVIAIVLFSLILLYGYNAIKGFKGRSEEIAYIKFKTDLVSTVNRVSPDYGTVKRESFFIGGEYLRVCFVQNYPDMGGGVQAAIKGEGDMVVLNSVQGTVDKNVFLFTTTLQESFDIGEITVGTSGYECIPIINGKAKIQFEGGGDHTHITTY